MCGEFGKEVSFGVKYVVVIIGRDRQGEGGGIVPMRPGHYSPVESSSPLLTQEHLDLILVKKEESSLFKC